MKLKLNMLLIAIHTVPQAFVSVSPYPWSRITPRTFLK